MSSSSRRRRRRPPRVVVPGSTRRLAGVQSCRAGRTLATRSTSRARSSGMRRRGSGGMRDSAWGTATEGRPVRSVVPGSIPGAVVASSATRRPDAGLAAERRALSAASLSPVLGRDEGVARGWRGDSFSFEIPPAGEVPPCDAPPPPPPDDEDARFCLKRSSDDAGRRVPSSPTMSARTPTHRVVVGTSNGRVDFLGVTEESSTSFRR